MKQKGILLLAAELTLICILFGCAPSNGEKFNMPEEGITNESVWEKIILEPSRNREKLNMLEVGMTKEQVLEIMGKPYLREAEGNNEWLIYITEFMEDRDESKWLTPLLIQDGKLIGWGRNFWMTKEKRYDVQIDQTIQQK